MLAGICLQCGCVLFMLTQNPQSDLQAQDRCHRIGQNRPVVVYRLVTANTVDQKIVERANAKRKLEKLVIHKGDNILCRGFRSYFYISPDAIYRQYGKFCHLV